MSDEEDEVGGDEGEGSPAWVMTFADLMSLLMCFFVLLLSFAELDILKFKQIAGSLKVAFGVQREVIASEIPKGTSVIAQEFSAGKPDPTIAPEVRQQTTEIEKRRLDVLEDEAKDEAKEIAGKSEDVKQENMQEQKQQEQIEEQVKKIKEKLKVEIDKKQLEIETEENRIIIRILERGAFPPSQAEFQYDFFPVLDKIRSVLVEVNGKIIVAGHTDDSPISTDRYRSNWELSAARAVSVAHALLESSDLHPNQIKLDPKRFVVQGLAGTQALVENDSTEHRAQNRRVEIIIEQDPAAEGDEDENVLVDDETLEGEWIEKQIFDDLDTKPKADGEATTEETGDFDTETDVENGDVELEENLDDTAVN